MRLMFLADVQFPFQTKRILRFTWITIILISFGFSVGAGDVVQFLDEKDSRQQIKQAEKFIRKGNPAEAEKILREVLTKDPSNSKAKLALSLALLKQRKLIDAYELTLAVAKNEPKNARAFSLLGMSLLNFGNFKGPMRFWDERGKLIMMNLWLGSGADCWIFTKIELVMDWKN